MKREGMHYKKKFKEERESYSIRSLVEEITGVAESNEGFDTAYKSVQRIISFWQSQDGIGKGTLQIQKDEKDEFVNITKGFFHEEELRDALSRIKRGKELCIEEYDKVIAHFVEHMIAEKPEAEAEKIREGIENKKGDAFFAKAQEVHDLIQQHIDIIDEVKDYSTKLEYMDDYMELLEKVLEEWGTKIESHILSETVYKRVLARRPELGTEEPLSEENFPPETMMEIMKEMFMMKMLNEKIK